MSLRLNKEHRRAAEYEDTNKKKKKKQIWETILPLWVIFIITMDTDRLEGRERLVSPLCHCQCHFTIWVWAAFFSMNTAAHIKCMKLEVKQPVRLVNWLEQYWIAESRDWAVHWMSTNKEQAWQRYRPTALFLGTWLSVKLFFHRSTVSAGGFDETPDRWTKTGRLALSHLLHLFPFLW